MKLKKGDKIVIITGKDKGREGSIDRLYPKQHKILVGGVNIVKKHIQKTDQTPQGGVIEIPRPFPVSNALLICPKCKKKTRVGYKEDGGRKIRICKRCKSNI